MKQNVLNELLIAVELSIDPLVAETIATMLQGPT